MAERFQFRIVRLFNNHYVLDALGFHNTGVTSGNKCKRALTVYVELYYAAYRISYAAQRMVAKQESSLGLR